MSKKKLPVKVGCCGYRMKLRDYAEMFNLVEIQHTFYQPPGPVALRRWREEVPEEFEFTLKAWQLITHESRSPTYRRLRRKLSETELAGVGSFRPTPIVREAWDVMRGAADMLRARSILFQCPASFKPTEENLENMRSFFMEIDRGDLRFHWEPRGSWPAELVRELCEELRLTHVVDPFATSTVTPEFVYYRLHGRTGFRYVYEEFELEELLEMIEPDAPAYVLFNNVKMREDGARFREVVRRAGRE
jgi:uncharacterized protein YecE (DUF72 family)